VVGGCITRDGWPNNANNQILRLRKCEHRIADQLGGSQSTEARGARHVRSRGAQVEDHVGDLVLVDEGPQRDPLEDVGLRAAPGGEVIILFPALYTYIHISSVIPYIEKNSY
jgi:hypothetical protein